VAICLGIGVWLYSHLSFGLVFPEVEPRPFDPQVWKVWTIEDMRQSEDIRRAFARRDMLEDLFSTRQFTGWTKAQLEAELGPPNDDFLQKGRWDVAYLVGMDFIDYVVLSFKLDANGRVTAYRVELI
jgi:hypothetical protein